MNDSNFALAMDICDVFRWVPVLPWIALNISISQILNMTLVNSLLECPMASAKQPLQSGLPQIFVSNLHCSCLPKEVTLNALRVVIDQVVLCLSSLLYQA